MKRVLVTGGTGFVGANLARRLLADGHEVHLFVRPGARMWRIAEIRKDLRLHVVDLVDRESLDPVIDQIQPEWVFHLAAYGAYPDQTDLLTMLRTNVTGTVNLLESCLRLGFEAFINTGSSSEYGYQAGAPSETARPEPNSLYAVTKVSATLFCQFTARARGTQVITLRLYSVYGPYEEPTRLVPTLIARGLAGDLPALVEPDVARDFVYVDDVIDAYLLAAMRTNPELGVIYNIGTGHQTTLRQIVELARKVLKVPSEPIWGSMPNRRWDTASWVSDSRRARRELGWQPRFSLADGFRATVDWFRGANTDWALYGSPHGVPIE